MNQNQSIEHGVSILYTDDQHLCVVFKPAGLLTVKNHEHEADALGALRNYMAAKRAAAGRTSYVVPLHFLDRDVSGLVMFALSSKAAARINEAIKTRQIKKFYVALVEGEAKFCEDSWCTLEHHLAPDAVKKDRMRVVVSPTKDTVLAKMRVRRIWFDKDKHQSLVLIDLETGRKHQIRLQLAAKNSSIVGDPWYGQGIPSEKFTKPCLQAQFLKIQHPVSGQSIEVLAPHPAWFIAGKSVWEALKVSDIVLGNH